MNHWDVYPGETVELASSAAKPIRGRFLCRDTLRARFDIDGQELDFLLNDDGTLRDYHVRHGGRRRFWAIRKLEPPVAIENPGP